MEMMQFSCTRGPCLMIPDPCLSGYVLLNWSVQDEFDFSLTTRGEILYVSIFQLLLRRGSSAFSVSRIVR